MRKKRMKKTEDEICRQSTSLNFLRVREKEKKRYKEKVLGDIYNDTHNYRLVAVVQHQDFQQKETSSSADCCCSSFTSFAHVTAGGGADCRASRVDLCVRRPWRLYYFSLFLYTRWQLPLDLFRVSLTRLEFQYFSIYRNLFVNWKNNETIFKNVFSNPTEQHWF